MLNHELRRDQGILVLHAEGPLDATDFAALSSQVDTYLERHTLLNGVLIRAESFPGWKDFDALLAHFKFLHRHLHRIEKVAVVAEGALASVMPNLANHFVHAEVRHFGLAQEDAAVDWLTRGGGVRAQSAA